MKYIKTFEVRYLNPDKKGNNKFIAGDYVKITYYIGLKDNEDNVDVFKVKHITKKYNNRTISSLLDFQYKLCDLYGTPLRFWIDEKYLRLATPEEVEKCKLNNSAKKYNL